MNILPFNRDLSNDIKMYQDNPDKKKGTFDPEAHKLNIERTFMERGIFNTDTRISKFKKINKQANYNNSKNIGEITGELLDAENIDQGMPTRFFLNSIDMQDNEKHTLSNPNNIYDIYNPKLDFFLYDTEPNINVSYYDPIQTKSNIQTQFSELDSLNELLPPLENINITTKNLSYINKFSIEMFKEFQRYFTDKYNILFSPYSICLLFSGIYKGSKNLTEKELKKMFFFPEKKDIYDSLFKLIEEINKNSNLIMYNSTIFPNNLLINKSYVDYINNLCIIDVINLSNIDNEITRLNNNIRYKTNGIINNMITNSIKYNQINIIMLSAIVYKLNFQVPFNEIKTDIFYGEKNRKIEMLYQYNTLHKYYEDNINQILEIDLDNNNFKFGIILPKNNSQLSIGYEQLEYYISKLSEKSINCIIPKFKQHTKYKLNNMFKNKGYNLFTNSNTDLSDITPLSNDIYITNVLHNSYVIMDNINIIPKKNNINTTNFIANHPFIYYIRYKSNNIIILIGTFV